MVSALAERMHCPDCGTELGSDAATAGLCPRCLLSRALVKSVGRTGEAAAGWAARAVKPSPRTCMEIYKFVESGLRDESADDSGVSSYL